MQLLVVLLDQPGSDLTMGREEEKASASAIWVRATGLGKGGPIEAYVAVDFLKEALRALDLLEGHVPELPDALLR